MRRYAFLHARCASSNVAETLSKLARRAGLAFQEVDHLAWMAGATSDLIVVRNAEEACRELVPADSRSIHLIRDPRDMLVSAYWAHRHSHGTAGWPELLPWRKRLESLSVDDGLFLELSYTAHAVDAIAGWDYRRPGTLELRAEDLFADDTAFFRRVAAYLGLPSDDDTLDVCIEPFGLLSGGRLPGSEDVHHHYRMGVAGDWKRYFNPRHRAEFERRWPGLVARLGYPATGGLKG